MSLAAVKQRIPQPMRITLLYLSRLVCYRNYDSSLYWKQRALVQGEAAVLWQNQHYNRLFRERQRTIVEPYLTSLPAGASVLDIGCGIGVVAKMMVDLNPDLHIDAVDFPEMTTVARRNTPLPQITYIDSSAEDYLDVSRRYHLVISSGCFSAIRDVPKMQQAVENCARMTVEGGRMLMIGPYHRCNLLARVKFGSGQMIRLMDELGFDCIQKSGVLFWPYREWLANSLYAGAALQRRFERGERILSLFGQHFWADYKILGFRKRFRGVVDA